MNTTIFLTPRLYIVTGDGRLFWLYLCLVGISWTGVDAAPLTLEFSGHISQVRNGIPNVQLPFSFAQGDTIKGIFTFEPSDVPATQRNRDVLVSGNWIMNVGGTIFQNDQYFVEIDDDEVLTEDPIPIDRISVTCGGSGSSCTTPAIENVDGVYWAFSWSLYGDSSVLSGADLPGEVSIWNRFSYKSTQVAFVDRRSGLGTGFEAELTTFAVAPEPAALMTLSIALLLLLTHSRIRHSSATRKQGESN